MKINCLYTLDNGREVLCDEFYTTPEGYNIWSWYSTMEGRMYYCEETKTHHDLVSIYELLTEDDDDDEAFRDVDIDEILNIIDDEIGSYLEERLG